MKFIMKIVFGVTAIGGFTYWLFSVFLRPSKKIKNKLRKRFPAGNEG